MYKKVEQKAIYQPKQLIPNRDPNNHNTPEVCPIFYLLSHSNFECRFSQNVKKDINSKNTKTDSLSTSYNQHFHYPIQT